MSSLFPILHILWISVAAVVIHFLPGFSIYNLVRRRELDLIEAVGFSLASSAVINNVSHCFFGFFGLSISASNILVFTVSVFILYFTAYNRGIKISYNRLELLTVLSSTLFFTLLLAIPGITHPEVLVRSDNQIHGGIVNSVKNTGIPPEAPNLAGYPLFYYWFYDLNAAITSDALGVHATSAIYFTNCIGFFTLLWFIWLLSKSFAGSNLVNAMSVIFFTFSLNSLNGIHIAYDILNDPARLSSMLGVSPILKALTGWGNASIFVGFLVGHAPALAMASIAAGLYCLRKYRSTGSLEYLGYLLAYTVMSVYVHPPIGIYFVFCILIFSLLSLFCGDWKKATSIALILFVSGCLILPYYHLLTYGKVNNIWDTYFRSFERGRRLLRSLFLHHLQIVGSFALIGLLVNYRRVNLTLSSALIAFTASYIFVNTPGGSWKNTYLMMIPLSLLAAGAFNIASRIPYRTIKAVFVVLPVLILISPTNLLIVHGYSHGFKRNTLDPISDHEKVAYRYLQGHTVKDSVVVFEERYYGRYMSHAERPAYLFNRHLIYHGYSPEVVEARRKTVDELLSARNIKENVEEVCSLRRESYLLVSPLQNRRNPDIIKKYADSHAMVYADEITSEEGVTTVIKLDCRR